MKSKRLLNLVMCLALILSLTSCARRTIISPISNQDIYKNEKGDTCFSDDYLKEVLNVKIDN